MASSEITRDDGFTEEEGVVADHICEAVAASPSCPSSMASSELTDGEREALLKAMLAGTANGSLGETVWLAARDYYEAEQQARHEELTDMVCKPRLEDE